MGSGDNATLRGSLGARWPVVMAILVVAAVVVVTSGAIIVAVHYATDINVLVLVVDPAAEVGLAPYVGVFSYIGILILWSGATVSLLASALARMQRDRSGMGVMLATYGSLLAFLAIDDLFLLHEELGLALAERLGRPEDRSLLEAPIFGVYALVWLVWLARNRVLILKTPLLLLFAGIGALGISVVIDIGEFVFPELVTATPWMNTTLNIAEELAKLGGIVLMAGYGVVTSVDLILRAVRASGDVVVPGAYLEQGGTDRAAR
jgi:hypothetical protein